MNDPVKLFLFITGALVLGAFVLFATRRHHPHTLPVVEISAEPIPGPP